MRGHTRRANQTNVTKAGDGLNFGQISLVFVGFAILYFATAVFFDGDTSKVTRDVSAGQNYGPIVTKSANTVVLISVTNRFLQESWAFIETEVLDDKGQTITAFGGDTFHESGRDSEGAWSDSKTQRDVRVVLPTPGRYFLKFRVSGGTKFQRTASDLTNQTQLRVTVAQKRGGSSILVGIGIILLILSVILNEIRNQTFIQIFDHFSSDDDD